jgi:hypothetical protein
MLRVVVAHGIFSASLVSECVRGLAPFASMASSSTLLWRAWKKQNRFVQISYNCRAIPGSGLWHLGLTRNFGLGSACAARRSVTWNGRDQIVASGSLRLAHSLREGPHTGARDRWLQTADAGRPGGGLRPGLTTLARNVAANVLIRCSRNVPFSLPGAVAFCCPRSSSFPSGSHIERGEALLEKTPTHRYGGLYSDYSKRQVLWQTFPIDGDG